MNHLPIHRDRQCLSSINDATHIFIGNLTVLDGNHSLGVNPFDVTAGNPGKNRLNFTTGHQFRFLECLANCGNRAFNVDNHALAHTTRRAGANANDIKSFLSHCPHNGTNLGCADI